jgi:hypothetical protein
MHCMHAPVHCMHVAPMRMHAPMQRFKNALAYFVTAVSYGYKMFIKLTPGHDSYKTFYGRNLQFFVIR